MKNDKKGIFDARNSGTTTTTSNNPKTICEDLLDEEVKITTTNGSVSGIIIAADDIRVQLLGTSEGNTFYISPKYIVDVEVTINTARAPCDNGRSFRFCTICQGRKECQYYEK